MTDIFEDVIVPNEAERQLLKLLRGHSPDFFDVRINCADGRWSINGRHGNCFAEVWRAWQLRQEC